MQKTDERIDQALFRAETFRAASAAFEDAPSSSTLAGLIEAAGSVLDEECASDAERALFGLLRGYTGADIDELRKKIASEYAELFVGPRPPLAPYYESLYVGSPRRLLTATTMEVRACYEREGMAVVKKNRVPDDHIAYELEFMARLCEREAAELEAGDETAAKKTVESELNFLERHLCRWTGEFAAAVEKAACSEFYLAWARYVDTLVKQDLEEMRAL